MNKLSFYLIAGILSVSNSIYAQELDTVGFNNFKRVIPYMIKGMAKEKSANINDITAGQFVKPWKVEKLSIEESNTVLDRFVFNSEFEIEQDYNDDWKLRFFSKIEDHPTIEAIYKSNEIFSNAFIAISNIEIVDSIGNDIYVNGSDKRIKDNIATELNISSSQISTNFLIGKKHDSVGGSFTLSLKEFETINFKEFENSFDSVSFDLGNYKNLTLLKVEENKAYFITPTKIENIEISATNENNETFASNGKGNLPIRIYEFAKTKNTDDDAINKFIETLTIDEVYKGAQVIVYETNGFIKNLYIYIKSEPKILASRKLRIKL